MIMEFKDPKCQKCGEGLPILNGLIGGVTFTHDKGKGWEESEFGLLCIPCLLKELRGDSQ